MRQIDKVQLAFRLGDETTREVSARTGLSVAVCSACTSALIKEGIVRMVGFSMCNFGLRGARAHLYQIIEVDRRDPIYRLPKQPIIDMYLGDNMSTVEIGLVFGSDPTNIRKVLIRNGISRRKRTVHDVCRIKDCSRPALKIRHATNGSVYGRLCEEHREAHYRRLNREGRRRRNKISEDRYEDYRTNEPENDDYREFLKARRLLKEARALIVRMERGNAGQPKNTE